MSFFLTGQNDDQQIQALRRAQLTSWGALNPARLKFTLRYAGQKILDVGCATGSYVGYLNKHGYDAYGVDLLPDPGWTAEGNVRTAVASATNLPLPDKSVDTVLCFETLEHILVPEQALAEIQRVSCKSLILSVPDCEFAEDMLRSGVVFTHWRDQTHCNFYSETTLRQALQWAGFQVQLIERINPIRPEYLIMRSLHIPAPAAAAVARLMHYIPWRRHYYMTLLAVAKTL